MRSFFD